jgi:Na+-driven multidrug efflux pump
MTSETNVSDILHYHLLIVPFSLGALGICMLMVSVANALGKSYTALTISALRLFAFFLPCLWVGAQLAGIEGLFWGSLVGNFLAGGCAWWMYQRALVQLEQQSADKEVA